MYSLVYTNRMKRDVKLMKKRGRDLDKLICPRKARDKERERAF